MSGYRVWSNASVPEADQFAHWADSVSEVFGSMIVEREQDGPFHMMLSQVQLGALTLSAVEASPHRSRRTSAMAASCGTGEVYVSVPRAGHLLGHQGSGPVAPPEGWLGMISGDEETDIVAPSDFRQVVIGIPRELVSPRLSCTAGVAFGMLAGLLGQITEYLYANADGFVRDDARRATDQVTDLVVACFGASAVGPSVESSLRLQAAMDHAENRLADPGLNSASLALHLNVSRRTIEQLFAERGTTVGRWVLERRLERARADLERNSMAGLTIEDIAQRWGFVDRTHFSRVFRGQFDVAPGAYRRSRQRLPDLD
ncbi:MAG TPA: helix-turn-helix domain-containing protein [Galbitalea sp.]|jgi:AraC-like DNA-binding protein|nr:helix-turn-helix domain-containing protein [Galbitalea sp.]